VKRAGGSDGIPALVELLIKFNPDPFIQNNEGREQIKETKKKTQSEKTNLKKKTKTSN